MLPLKKKVEKLFKSSKTKKQFYVFEFVFQRSPSGVEFWQSKISVRFLSIWNVLHFKKKIGKKADRIEADIQ